MAANNRDVSGSRHRVARPPARRPATTRNHPHAGSDHVHGLVRVHPGTASSRTTSAARPSATTEHRPLPPIRLRVVALLVVMVMAFVAIGVRLFDLQARDRTHLTSLGVGQRVRTVDIPAERGNIFDRTGKILAVSVPQTTITADPRVIKDPAGTPPSWRPCSLLEGADRPGRARGPAGEPHERVRVRRSQGRRRRRPRRSRSSTSSASRTSPSRSASIRPARWPAPVLGFVGTDNTGLGGLEYGYDKALEGSAGTVQVERDPAGQRHPGRRAPGARPPSAARTSCSPSTRPCSGTRSRRSSKA